MIVASQYTRNRRRVQSGGANLSRRNVPTLLANGLQHTLRNCRCQMPCRAMVKLSSGSKGLLLQFIAAFLDGFDETRILHMVSAQFVKEDGEIMIVAQGLC